MPHHSQKQYNIIGIMSGTSLDGLDIAYGEFMYLNGKWKFNSPRAETVAYDFHWKNKLKHAHKESLVHFLELDRAYGIFIGQQIQSFCKKHNLKPDYISSHGHTIFHQPEKKLTCQLGHGASIYAVTGIPTIADFRVTDMALGGHGAPLVPIGDELLFGEYEYCLNIGGIANMSYSIQNKRIAFDICPANFILNYLAQQINKEYDKNGELAKSGTLNQKMLNELNAIAYYRLPSPKSLGREYIERHFLPIIDSYTIPIHDKLHTYCHHIIFQVAEIVNKLSQQKNKTYSVLMTGGGAWNTFLWNELAPQYLRSNIPLFIPDNSIVDFKEALVFAFLGVLRIRNEINCLSSVTGASIDSCGGVIFGV